MATITGNSLLRQLEGKPAGLLKIGLFILLIISTFPNFLPRSRDSGLDQSWVIGLNEAAARGMIFGKEIIFTYGPLGFIDAPIDTGANVTIAAYFRFAIFFLFLLSIALIVFPSTSLVVSSLYILVFIALTFLGTRFYLLIELHLLLAVLGFLVFSQLRQSMLWAIPAAALAGLALLVKFSIGMACASSFGIWAVVTLAQNPSMKTFFELSFLSLVFLAFFIGLFSLFGGPPATLIDYVRYSMVISRGYSSQMSGAPFGNIFDLILAIFQIALLGTLVLSGAPSNRRYLILPILLAPSLFFLFKGGFVRYDRFHAEDYFTVIPAMAGFFLLIAKERWEKIAGSIMVCAVLMLSFVWHFSLFPSFSNPVANGYHRIRDLAQWSSGRERIRNQDADVIKQQKLPSPILAKIGTQRVDAYPWDISIPLANSLNWNPRFVFQSYSAYSPELDEANARHYRSEEGPAFILYSHKAIDGQHPLTTDPLTWLELFRWYAIQDDYVGLAPIYYKDQLGEMVLLRRRQTPRCGEPQLLGERQLSLGERWEVPSLSGDLILLQAQFKLRTLGAWRDWCFKNYAPEIFVEYQNGAKKKFRLVWRNAASGFLVSDLPLELPQVRSLWEKGEGSPVTAITFIANEKHFKNMVAIRWLKLPLLAGQ